MTPARRPSCSTSTTVRRLGPTNSSAEVSRANAGLTARGMSVRFFAYPVRSKLAAQQLALNTEDGVPHSVNDQFPLPNSSAVASS